MTEKRSAKTALARMTKSFLFFFAVALAVEAGLRWNSSVQQESRSGPIGDAEFNIVSFGDSVSARYPTLVERLLNGEGSEKTATVINLYHTAPNRGSFISSVRLALERYRPRVAMIMLDSLEFRTRTSLASSTAITESKLAKVSLLARALYLKVLPLSMRLRNWWNEGDSPVGNTEEVDSAALSELIDELTIQVCCSETGASKAQEYLSKVAALKAHGDSNLLKVASFLSFILARQLDAADATLRQILEIKDEIPLLKEPEGVDRVDIKIPLKIALEIERGAFDVAVDLAQSQIVKGHASEFLCAMVANAARSNARADIESIVVRQCLESVPHSVRIGFLELDLLVRSKNDPGVNGFLPRLAELSTSSRRHLLLGRMHYLVGSHFFQKGDFPKAKIYFEKALLLDGSLQRAINYYIITLEELKKASRVAGKVSSLQSSIPQQVLTVIDKNDRFGRKYRVDGTQTMIAQVSARGVEELRSESDDRSDETADLPASYVEAINSLCAAGSHVIILNNPQQKIGPLRRALSDVPCLRFVDLHTLIFSLTGRGKYKFYDIFENDDYHLTLLGDEIVAGAICREIKSHFGARFSAAACGGTSLDE